MKQFLLTLGAACVLSSFAASQTPGEPCAKLNHRPAYIGPELGSGLNIQDAINDLTFSGPVVNAYVQQSPLARFMPIPDRDLVVTYIDGTYGAGLVIGLYDGDDPLNRIPLFFSGYAATGDVARVEFLPNGLVTVNGMPAASGFQSCFGVFMEVWGGMPNAGGSGNPNVLDWQYFSDDSLCRYGFGQMVSYRGNGKTAFVLPDGAPFLFNRNSFLFGFEVHPCFSGFGTLQSDFDYNEAMILMDGAKKWRKLRFLEPRV